MSLHFTVISEVDYDLTETFPISMLNISQSIGSDLFLDNLIHNYLKSLLHSYTHSSQLASLDFDSPIPGITSFYDL